MDKHPCMKHGILLALLLLPVLGLSVTSPSQITITGNQTLDVSIFEAPNGTRLSVTWTNEKIDVFPALVPIDRPSLVPTIHIIPQAGACGKSNITFTVASTASVTEMDLGACSVLPGEINPDTSVLGKRMWELHDEIARLNEYLLMTPQVQAYIDKLKVQIEEANSIDITVSQAEFTRKDIMVNQILADINQLDLAFRGINKELAVPALFELSDTLDDFGNSYLLGKVEETVGPVDPVDDVLYYRRKTRARVTTPDGEKPYTLYTVRFYNPTSSVQYFLYTEDLSVDTSSQDPYTNRSITLWNITLLPKDLRTLKYGVNRDVEEAITSMAVKQRPPAPTCTDRIQNQDETGIDCGGPCPACPEPEREATCFDNLWNQGEAGIDCGGPCEKLCTAPLPPKEDEPEPAPGTTTRAGPLDGLFSVFDLLLGGSGNATRFADNYLALLSLLLPK